MNKLLALTLVLLLLPGIVGCSSDNGQSQTVTPVVDEPLLTADEACAFVYDYLETKAEAAIIGWRMPFLPTLSDARSQFSAIYQGSGKWNVHALGLYSQVVDGENREYYSYSGGL